MYNSFRSQAGSAPKGDRKFSKKGTWNRAGAGKRLPKELHDAVCSECGKPCQVPFFPSEGRPVKCRDCFRTDDAPRTERRSFSDRPSFREDRPSFRPSSGTDVESRLRSIERKLDNILELLDADEI